MDGWRATDMNGLVILLSVLLVLVGSGLVAKVGISLTKLRWPVFLIVSVEFVLSIVVAAVVITIDFGVAETTSLAELPWWP
jgi:hypothetical protein